jgi:hypothetical protein
VWCRCRQNPRSQAACRRQPPGRALRSCGTLAATTCFIGRHHPRVILRVVPPVAAARRRVCEPVRPDTWGEPAARRARVARGRAPTMGGIPSSPLRQFSNPLPVNGYLWWLMLKLTLPFPPSGNAIRSLCGRLPVSLPVIGSMLYRTQRVRKPLRAEVPRGRGDGTDHRLRVPR